MSEDEDTVLGNSSDSSRMYVLKYFVLECFRNVGVLDSTPSAFSLNSNLRGGWLFGRRARLFMQNSHTSGASTARMPTTAQTRIATVAPVLKVFDVWAEDPVGLLLLLLLSSYLPHNCLSVLSAQSRSVQRQEHT